ncbi:hypothetical protein LTR70_003918 [Exophiala xenobiotica]|uniref:Uncharacterized protein n=1 Tax=Lithohypha guttulata TaxID=1690604 RepID=A0ABR0KF87_9EURO|nr:hypothetical protein LTR24_003392 [Lithohypha guttulata]KAK5322237.1 hypothetical protein LTR70_003918 [Exophiala xenobiotica]
MSEPSSSASSGALSPSDATQETFKTGLQHLYESPLITLTKSFYGGLLLSAGGLLSLTIAGGVSDMSPGLSRLLQGITFPVGLVIIYFVGAELYTGYPMWFAITALERKGTPWLYVSRAAASWVGGLLGALVFAYFFTYLTQSLDEEPFRSGPVNMVTSDIVDKPWHVIFLKAIPCGFLVTMAMFLGSQNKDGISKAMGLHLPFFLSVAARYPHIVEYMYVSAVGILLGAPLGWAGYFGKCLAPITLGNTIGGAVFTGFYQWFVFMECVKRGWTAEAKSGEDEDEDGRLRL